jgi:hypothetical protein
MDRWDDIADDIALLVVIAAVWLYRARWLIAAIGTAAAVALVVA